MATLAKEKKSNLPDVLALVNVNTRQVARLDCSTHLSTNLTEFMFIRLAFSGTFG